MVLKKYYWTNIKTNINITTLKTEMKTQNLDNINIETNLNTTSTSKVQSYENTHKLVSLLTVAEQGTFVLLLVLDKRLKDGEDDS